MLRLIADLKKYDSVVCGLLGLKFWFHHCHALHIICEPVAG